MVESLRPALVNASIHAATSQRNSMMSIRSKSPLSSSVTEIPKPVASGSGVSCSILLAEPNVFLTGFEHDGHSRRESQNSTALLRGKLQLKVTKNIKIKSVTLRLVGRARTEWPEGIPPLKTEFFEELSLRTQVLTFFHAMHDNWETDYGNQCTFTIKSSPSNGSSTNLARPYASPTPSVMSVHLNNKRHSTALTTRELNRLSLMSVQSRSFGKSESPHATVTPTKGFKTFYPGTYEYSFELPIDHHQLETTKLHFGSVKWELQTTVERVGAFKPNLNGTKEVSIVRVPDQMSLEMTEPISISRQWEDQLHYDIIISGKSFPIGGRIPIAFKLTPLAKVQIHKLKVFVSESIEYWTNDRRVTRKDPGRKILLLEKTAGKPLEKRYSRSEVRFLSGGELDEEQRIEARSLATWRRNREASRSNSPVVPLPEPSDNILGELDLGLESYWGSTEVEMNVQLPTCEQMAREKLTRLSPDCSWKNVNVYHWIKIVMRISRVDHEDPTGKKRRHFEISIDSPFTVLNCRATQANTSLPEYTGPDGANAGYRQQMSCGCPDASVVNTYPSPSSSAGTLPGVESGPDSPASTVAGALGTAGLLAPPQAAHLQAPSGRSPAGSAPGPSPLSSCLPLNSSSLTLPQTNSSRDSSEASRPMHLIRCPSYNPPAFDADEPPPPLASTVLTPPPRYDMIVGTPSVDGLADYFARLADYEDPSQMDLTVASGANGLGQVEEDSDSADEALPARILERSGRVNVLNPRTPGGRLVPSRSLEIERPVFELNMASVVRRGL